MPQSSSPPIALPHPAPIPVQDVNFSDSSAQLLADARVTFARLEREAEVSHYGLANSYQRKLPNHSLFQLQLKSVQYKVSTYMYHSVSKYV